MSYDPRGDHVAGHSAPFEGTGFIRVRGRRPVTDYGTSMVQWMRNRRPRYRGAPVCEMERPSASYIMDILPPAANLQNSTDAIPSKHLHSSLNKIKHPINIVRWTPEGRRLLTGSSSGEFTLWNGMGFNFETIMQAHDAAIRAASYSHNDEWLVSADQDGVVKYWQTNFNNVKAIQAHNDPIRDLAFSPTDSKFVTASDDASLKIFDFAGGIEESVLTGHNWDAKTVDWHPTKGLLVSGSKDHQVKLWDPRTGRCLTTLYGHKNTISKTAFEPRRGQLLATCARDQTARVFDLRMMRDVCLLRGHEKDVSTITWHPIHANLLSTGGADGSLFHYLLDEPNQPPGTEPSVPPYDTPDPLNAPAQTIYPAHRVPYAHDFAIWSLDWHPLGHILASGSNDRVTRFWSRARPGETDCFIDRYHIGEAAAEAQGTWDRRGGRRQMREDEEAEMEDEAEGLVDQKMPTRQPMLPGIPGLPVPASALADLPRPPGIGGGAAGGVPSLPTQIPGMGNLAAPPPPILPGLSGLVGGAAGAVPPPPPVPPGAAPAGGTGIPGFGVGVSTTGPAPPGGGPSGNVVPPPPPPPLGSLPGLNIPGLDPSKLAAMIGSLPPPPPPPPHPSSTGPAHAPAPPSSSTSTSTPPVIPPPPPHHLSSTPSSVPPPPPVLPGTAPAPFPGGILPPGLLPPNFQFPPGFPIPNLAGTGAGGSAGPGGPGVSTPPVGYSGDNQPGSSGHNTPVGAFGGGGGGGGIPGLSAPGGGGGGGGGGVGDDMSGLGLSLGPQRRRTPLPSQRDSLKEEQKRGHYRISR
ncbi:WD40 repeat-like protein [Xylona heveae TC161]|uniref:Polyadenylation factor subunit 2 n=1 Tax=Xylona heveae (strain CBS 132557 / TC161) TaxID=1328760 RepID=A0A165G0G5_XYLHT|nr:WD40 repeat-like protein [Xylona heveae TC161]KZF21594.1 WD40 repeat-like protein [Xylona heveae TC161]